MNDITFVETPIYNSKNYFDHKAFFDFMYGKPITSFALKRITQFNPSESRILFCLGYLTMLQNKEISRRFFLKSWIKYCEDTVSVLLETLNETSINAEEKMLLSVGLALWSYPFEYDERDISKELECVTNEMVESFCSLELDTDEKVWAMYAVGNRMLDEILNRDNRKLSTVLALANRLGEVKEKFVDIEEMLPHGKLPEETNGNENI